MAVQIVGHVHPAYVRAEEVPDEELKAERKFKRLHSIMREALGRNNLVDQNGLEVLPSAQSQQCRVCRIKETKACCEGDCQLYRDLVFAWQVGLSPVEGRIISETEREEKFDLLINPCQNCKCTRRHLDLRIMQMVPTTCSGTRSRKFREVIKGME